MKDHNDAVRAALAELPRWHVVHWGDHGSSTLMCLWVAGQETIVPIDGDVATFARTQHSIHDGGLVPLLRQVQQIQDRKALQAAEAAAARERLLRAWSVDDLSAGQWSFPRGGFVRWLNNSNLHLEAGDFTTPTAPELARVLVDLGWNAPDDIQGNCWIRPGPADVEEAADLAVLTPLAAFGCAVPPPLS